MFQWLLWNLNNTFHHRHIFIITLQLKSWLKSEIYSLNLIPNLESKVWYFYLKSKKKKKKDCATWTPCWSQALINYLTLRQTDRQTDRVKTGSGCRTDVTVTYNSRDWKALVLQNYSYDTALLIQVQRHLIFRSRAPYPPPSPHVHNRN